MLWTVFWREKSWLAGWHISFNPITLKNGQTLCVIGLYGWSAFPVSKCIFKGSNKRHFLTLDKVKVNKNVIRSISAGVIMANALNYFRYCNHFVNFEYILYIDQKLLFLPSNMQLIFGYYQQMTAITHKRSNKTHEKYSPVVLRLSPLHTQSQLNQ